MRHLRTIFLAAFAATAATVAPATNGVIAAAAIAEERRAAPHSHSHADARHWAAIPKAAPITTVNPGPWCGAYTPNDNTANEVGNGSPKFHVVIAVPRDVAAEVAYQAYGWQQLADDAFRTVKRVEAFLLTRVGIADVGQGAPYGWSWRFDYGTTCGAPFPDISFFEMPRTQAQYLADPQPFFPITDDLRASGKYSAANKRYLVHYVGSHPSACGQSYVYDPTDATGGSRYSVVYNFLTLGLTQAGGTLPSPECGWETDAHELGHSIGAATGGPNNDDGFHTWDCWNDVMSYAAVTAVCGDGQMYFDYRHDNYLMHGGGWYDTRYSAYWCKNAVC